jgi:hypothetical protein
MESYSCSERGDRLDDDVWKSMYINSEGNKQGDLGPMLRFFKYFRREIQRKNWRFWLKTKLNYAKFWYDKNASFFRWKLSKIAENCDHNIDPWCVGEKYRPKCCTINLLSKLNARLNTKFWLLLSFSKYK